MASIVAARADSSFAVIDPATEERYATSPVSGAADVDAAFSAAAAAFEKWSETTPAERQLALFRIADAMEARAEEFADLESKDTGKPRATLVEDEILLSVDQIRFFAGEARNLEGKSAGEYMKDHTSFVRREPIGVIGQVTPWNYPLNMAVWKFAPALAAGNTTVLKPSDTTPSSTLLLAEVAAEFLPKGVLNVITGDRTTGARMIEHKTPQMVSITGSVRAGMEVAKTGGERPQAGAPRARRQGAGHRLRRRRHRRRGRRASRLPGTSMPGRTAPPRPACSCRRASTTSSWRRSRRTRRTTRRRALRTRTASSSAR